MYQKDYILRLIEVFVKFLSRILRLKENKEYQLALNEIGEAYRTLVGLPVELVHSFNDVELLSALRIGNQWTPERCEILAALLKEEGDNLLALDQIDDAMLSFVKSMSLFLELPDQREQIAELVVRLKDQVLPSHILRKLLRHFEEVGHYDQAENILFDLAEREGPKMVQEGREFYARLKQKSRVELQNGSLPLEELDSGLRDLERICEINRGHTA